jgi:hypothetical protein
MSLNYPAVLEGIKRVFKRPDTFLLTFSLAWFIVAAIFHRTYAYLSQTLVVTGVVAALLVIAAIIWSLKHPTGDTLFEYAVPAIVSVALALYVGAALPFYAYPVVLAVIAIALAVRGRQP